MMKSPYSVMIVIVLAISGTMLLANKDDPAKKTLMSVYDLQNEIEIRGRLGIPLETVITISGSWEDENEEGAKAHADGFATKPTGPYFKVFEINGEQCIPVYFRSHLVEVLDSKEWSGHQSKDKAVRDETVWTARAFEVIDIANAIPQLALDEMEKDGTRKKPIPAAGLIRRKYESKLKCYRISRK